MTNGKIRLAKPHYINAIDEIHDAVRQWVEKQGLSENQEVSEEFCSSIDEVARELR